MCLAKQVARRIIEEAAEDIVLFHDDGRLMFSSPSEAGLDDRAWDKIIDRIMDQLDEDFDIANALIHWNENLLDIPRVANHVEYVIHEVTEGKPRKYPFLWHFTSDEVLLATNILDTIRVPVDASCLYTPGHWVTRGEQYGRDSLLIITHDGGDHAPMFNIDYCSKKFDDMQKKWDANPKLKGLYYESCTCWYTAVYKVG